MRLSLRKCVKRLLSLVAVFVFAAGLVIGGSFEAKAETLPFEVVTKVTVDGRTFYTRLDKGYEYSNESGSICFDCHELVMKVGAQKTVIDTCVAGDFIVNHRVLYYTKLGDENTIYKYDMKTGEKKEILSGEKLMVYGRNGAFLYYGVVKTNNEEDGLSVNMYAYNMMTDTKRSLGANMQSIDFCRNRMLLVKHGAEDENKPVYLFEKNGQRVDRLCDAVRVCFKDRYVYCVVAGEKGDRVKVVRYTMDGTEEKTVVKWTKDWSKADPYK